MTISIFNFKVMVRYGEAMTGKGYGRGGLGRDIVSPRSVLYFNPCSRNDIVRSGTTVV